MGIDYVIDLGCVPKQQLGTEGIVERVKAGSRAEAVLEMLGAEGAGRSPEDVRFEVALQTPEETTVKEVTVAELRAFAAELEPLRVHCQGCPANGDRPGFGCYRSIAYPIPAEAEAWLLDLLPVDLSTTAGQILIRAIDDFDWDGAHAAEMRSQGDTFFESADAMGVSWTDDDDGPQVTSDQLFHLLFHVGPIGSTHAFMACLFFGVVPHNLPVDALGDTLARARVLQTATVPQPPTEACGEMATFLHTLATAARLDVDVLVDG